MQEATRGLVFSCQNWRPLGGPGPRIGDSLSFWGGRFSLFPPSSHLSSGLWFPG